MKNNRDAMSIATTLGMVDFLSTFEKSKEDFKMHQLKRRIRYYCFSMQRGDDSNIPKEFITHFENAEGFEGWAKFAKTWDVIAEQPCILYPRDFSIHEEWDATIRRVVPELPVDRIWRQGKE